MTSDLADFSSRDTSIYFTGYVDDPKPYLQDASVFIAPIKSGGGTKLKVLEAMAVGKAVVTTSVGCEGIAGAHGEHFLVADSSKDFADSIIKLLRDDRLREFLQANASQFVHSRYSYDAICKKLDDFYTQKVSKLLGSSAHTIRTEQ